MACGRIVTVYIINVKYYPERSITRALIIKSDPDPAKTPKEKHFRSKSIEQL